MLALSTLTVDLTYWHLAGGLVLFGAGMGLAGTPSTTAITASLPPAKQGVGSAVNDTSRELGSALGIAILGTILNAGYRNGITPPSPACPPGGHPGPVLHRLPPRRRRPAHRARPRRRHPHHRRPHAFVDAATTAFATAATVLITTAVVAALTAPRRDYTTHEGAGAAKNDQAQEGADPVQFRTHPPPEQRRPRCRHRPPRNRILH